MLSIVTSHRWVNYFIGKIKSVESDEILETVTIILDRRIYLQTFFYQSPIFINFIFPVWFLSNRLNMTIRYPIYKVSFYYIISLFFIIYFYYTFFLFFATFLSVLLKNFLNSGRYLLHKIVNMKFFLFSISGQSKKDRSQQTKYRKINSF